MNSLLVFTQIIFVTKKLSRTEKDSIRSKKNNITMKITNMEKDNPKLHLSIFGNVMVTFLVYANEMI